MNTKNYSAINISITSFSLLLYQIFLTRVFSVITWYHLAFLAISLSMFGLCIGAYFTFQFPNFFSIENFQKTVFGFGVAMGTTISLSILFLSVIGNYYADPFDQISTLLLVFVFCALPFFFGGSVISILIKHYNGHLGRLYAFDLFAGAFACFAVVLILKFLSVPDAMALLGGINVLFFCLASTTPLVFPRIRKFFLVASLVLIAALSWGQINSSSKSWFPIRNGKTGGDYITPLYEVWNSFSRISVAKNYELRPFGWGLTPRMPEFQIIKQYQLAIDGVSGTALTQFDGDVSKLEFLKYDSVNIAHFIRNRSDVFIIGVGGGRDILSALVFNQKSVAGVELNDSILHTLNNRFGEFTGHLDRLKSVSFINDEARSYLTRSEKKYDLIVMSLIDTFAATTSGAFSLSENAVYTKQAFTLFLKRLNDGGVVSVSRWWFDHSPHEAYRLLNLAVETLKDSGVKEPNQHIYMVKTKSRSSEFLKDVNVTTLLMSNKPFSPSDIATLDSIVEKLDLASVINPNLAAQGTVAEILSGSAISDQRLSQFNLDSPTDNNPFFFQIARFDSLNPMKILDPVVRSLVWLLWFGLIFLIIAVSASFLFNRSSSFQQLNFAGLTSYFAFIGIGYLLVELSQMQRLSIFLGHPVYSLTTTLFTFLFCSALGSFFSAEIQSWITGFKLQCSLVGFLAILIISGLFTPKAIEAASHLELVYRILISISLLAPAAFFMGIMLPIGLSLVPEGQNNTKVWLWAVNGASSVFSSILASVISIFLGISHTFWTGFTFYLLATLTLMVVLIDAEEKVLLNAT